MKIEKKSDGQTLLLSLEGRLDTTTAPALEAELEQSLEGITELIWDFRQLEYISSAGLRVLLITQKKMNKQGCMTVTGVKPMILEIFQTTGFADFLTIEKYNE